MRSLRWTPFLFAVAACGDNHPQNQPPIVADREVTTPEDTALEFAVAATDPEGKALDIRLTGAQHGQLVSTATSWRYTPASDYHGPDQLVVTVSDGELTSTARIDLTITPVNDAPVAADDSFAVAEDGRLEIQFATFMANDTDVDGPAPTMLGLTPGSGGEVTMADGRVTFVPTVDYVGEATFTYSISDGEFSALGRVTVLVGGVNDAPTAAADVVAGTEDTELVIPVATLLANDTDIEGQTLAIASVTDAIDGEVVLDGTVVRFTPGRDHAGAASFAYVVTDGASTDRGAVTIELTAVDDPPTLAGGAATVDEDAALALPLAGADVDSTSLTYAIATPPAHGAASIVGAELRYQPGLNYHGADALTVTVSDGLTTSAPAPIALTIAGVIECGDGEREGNEVCDDGNAIDTDGCRTSCAAAACGDGVVQAGVEACDDGNAIDTDGCRTSCAVASCGDGVVRAGVEACDDGNAIDTDGCRTSCAVASCGDGVVQAGVEACDDANSDNADACLNACVAATCGDGVVQAGVEACDDANAIDTDACLTSCVAATCGDGLVQAGVEACDDGNAIDTDACLTSCVAAACGDGFVRAGLEACDDANAIDTDGCLSSCVAATCGDGLVQAGVEACDDGNGDNTDGCLSSCAAAACGDGFVQAGLEACDDANLDNTDACLTSCVAATCGDGFARAGVEECDDANGDNTDDCLTSCVAATCGDGFVQAGFEACDDGDSDNTDACLNTCAAATCGDGVIQAGLEVCDDGNSDPADACDACLPTTPPVCGDGTVDAGEECDDGNLDDQDACSHACLDEYCGDGAVQYGLGEICDDGNGDTGDGCDVTCQLEGGFTTIAPVLVSGAMSCTISQSNTGRKVAIDSLGNVYVAMVCGGNAYVAISSDRGQTYGAPVALGMTGINEMAIAAGAPGTAYVAASGGGVARFTRTEDAGATWSAPIDLASSSDFEISIEAFNDDVFVGVGGGSGVIVLRNSTRGVGAFTQTDVAVSQVFFDVIYDDRTDTLLVCTDTPDFHLRVSTDRGATFASEVNPTGMAFYSDWAIGNGVIYVAGTSSGSDNLLLIPAASPGTSSSVAGLPMTNQSSQRALAADPSGNSYIATTLDSGAVQLDRLLYGTTTFAAPRTVIASGTYPGVTALPTSNGVAMIYASAAGGIYATIQTY